jgi:SAM-dependent methyltransferase
VLVGAIPSSIDFAGNLLRTPLPGGNLFRCLSCGLAFRYPRLSKADLDLLYCQGNAGNWQSAPAARPDWQIANKWISRYLPTACSILDIGCFDGEFLRSIGAIHNRFGIEIHEGACGKARESGIHIIGSDFATMPEINKMFDVVTSFDVIEHSHNPMEFLAKLAGVTQKNGIIIISTGNSDAFGWRLLGGHYWYCAIGEHLSFPNPNWCRWAAPLLGLELEQVVTFSHVNATWRQWLADVAKNLFYAVLPRGFAYLRAMGMGDAIFRGHKELLKNPPKWMSAKDHFLCLFVKK